VIKSKVLEKLRKKVDETMLPILKEEYEGQYALISCLAEIAEEIIEEKLKEISERIEK
jgi:hypothetical protein